MSEAKYEIEGARLNALLAAVSNERDIDAFEALYKYFTPKLRSYMLKLTKDQNVADELTQETFVAIWRKAAQFDPVRGHAATWIFTIARNLRIDAFRRGPRPDFDVNDPALVPAQPEAADIGYKRNHDAARLKNAIETLSQEQIDTVKMFYFEDMTHATIATKMNVPLGTVKSRIRMACQKLRYILGEDT